MTDVTPVSRNAENVLPGKAENEPWLVLIADDDADVHMVTRLVLDGFSFEGRRLELVSCYSAQQTCEYLKAHPEVAVILLDVVMEHYSAGLEAVERIRTELENRDVRILLRSGQPGYADISHIINTYEINNYIRKESIRYQELKDAVLIALRSYRDIQAARHCEF